MPITEAGIDCWQCLNMASILSIDPSGTGTTDIYVWWGMINEFFYQYQSNDWTEYLTFIRKKVQEFRPSIIIYEHTNYIGLKGKDMTSLFKLFGAIETLPLFLAFVDKLATAPVHQVKGLKQPLLKGAKTIPGLTYQLGRGKGWKWEDKKISVHQLDALLVYWLWKDKQK